MSKEWLGLISIILGFATYAPYYYSMIKGRTKPHLFSWIIWSIVNSIVFFGQYIRDAGPGAWVTGLTALLSIGVAVFSLFIGKKDITKGDWFALVMALLAIIWWKLSNDPLGAVIIATAIDVLGCYPTIRKSYLRPHEESLPSWTIASVRSFVSIFAIENYNLVTTIFPVAMIFTNGGVASIIILRRYVLKREQ